MPPGFTGTYSSAYREIHNPGRLPLFCYTAIAFHKGEFYAAGLRIDKTFRHDPRFIDISLVKKNIKSIKGLFPDNRLVTHLADCALVYGCPGAQNFFLSRYECPLPVSPYCNARCKGCISLQTQPRIKFVPRPEEVMEIALFHIKNVRNPVLSFGQGCEGEPLLMPDVLERSIRLIRGKTRRGTININTNASKPRLLARLFDIGLDSIRVSLNSARQEYYLRYYKPKGYTFKDVLGSIKIAKKKKGFVSLNYLTMPGFTDSKEEFSAFKKFIETYKIDMIQWRNLNFDPLEYFKVIKCRVEPADMLGIRQVMRTLEKTFPGIRMGYYNPPSHTRFVN